MKYYSSFTEEYVHDIFKALNDAKFVDKYYGKPFNYNNFKNLTDFLQGFVIGNIEIYEFLNQKGLVNRLRCPYTGQQIGFYCSYWSYQNRAIHVSDEGLKIMQCEADENNKEQFGTDGNPVLEIYNSFTLYQKMSLMNLLITIVEYDGDQGNHKKEQEYLNEINKYLNVKIDECMAYLQIFGFKRMEEDLKTLTEIQKFYLLLDVKDMVNCDSNPSVIKLQRIDAQLDRIGITNEDIEKFEKWFDVCYLFYKKSF